MLIKLLLICFSKIKLKVFKQTTTWFLRFLSFGIYLNLTIPLFVQLVAQSLQRNSNSKQQFVLTNFVETPIFPNFEQLVKRLFTSIWNVTIALGNCRLSLL